MDRELPIILLLPLSSLFWMIGGWRSFWIFRHNKIFRWLLLPLLVFAPVVWLYTHSVLHTAYVAAAGMICFSQPYGSTQSWAVRLRTALLYSTVSMIFGLNAWQLLPPGVFLITWALSNWRATQQIFLWKICEGSVGFSVAVPLAFAIYNYGVT